MKKWLILLLLLVIAGALCFAAGRLTSPKRVETIEIPGEIVEKMVPVEVVKEIKVPGPERVRVVEKIVWKTKQVPVDREVLVNICPGGDEAEDYQPEARVAVEAQKFHGTVGNELRQGWVGSADCLVRRAPDAVWGVLASSPFDLTESAAVSTVAPEAAERVLPGRLELRAGLTSRPGLAAGASWYRQGRRWGLWAAFSYDLDPFSVYDSQVDRSRSDGALAVSGGVARRFGRR